jgi:hypothetical protein
MLLFTSMANATRRDSAIATSSSSGIARIQAASAANINEAGTKVETQGPEDVTSPELVPSFINVPIAQIAPEKTEAKEKLDSKQQKLSEPFYGIPSVDYSPSMTRAESTETLADHEASNETSKAPEESTLIDDISYAFLRYLT